MVDQVPIRQSPENFRRKMNAILAAIQAKTDLITIGTGDPEGVVTASRPAIYLREDGGAGTTLYVKETATGNTGWAAK